VVAAFGELATVVTANGDIYANTSRTLCGGTWAQCGNVFGGPPTGAGRKSFRGLKARHR
jgi:hypothetical protein